MRELDLGGDGGRRYKGGCGETCAEYTGGDELCEGKAGVQY
jgi:hypothetical protein